MATHRFPNTFFTTTPLVPLRTAISSVAVASGDGPAKVTVEIKEGLEAKTSRIAVGSEVVTVITGSSAEKVALTLEGIGRDSKEEELVVKVTASAEATVELAKDLVLASYGWDRHITDEKRRHHRVKTYKLLVASPADVEAAGLSRTLIVAEGTCFTRDIGNMRPREANVGFYAHLARQIAEEFGMKITVLDHAALVAQGLHLLAAVGQGAPGGSNLVLLDYKGGGGTAMVGKGVVFDTGGLDIKPAGQFANMSNDANGACAVLSAARTLARLNCPNPFTAVLCLAENSVDAHSFHPGDILRSFKGLTVEIGHTDAEGRLCLSDGIAYVEKHRDIKQLVNIATLTGASVVALGENLSAFFAKDHDNSFSKDVQAAARSSGERIWAMPITPEHDEDMKSTVADLRNLGTPGKGGACTAAAFLKAFVTTPRWAHLDIAGPGMLAAKKGIWSAGATGFGTALLVDLVSAQKSEQ